MGIPQIVFGSCFALFALILLYLDFFRWDSIRGLTEGIRMLRNASEGQRRAFSIFSHSGAFLVGIGAIVIGLTPSLWDL